MRGKAYRRHQSNRMFNKALIIGKSLYDDLEVAIDYARAVKDRLQSCSCYMCGNPRKHFDEITQQEKKAEAVWWVDQESQAIF